MRRLLITLAVAVPVFGVAVAHGEGTGGSAPPSGQANVVGTIVSVNATNGTFVAKAFVVPSFGGPGGPGGFGGFGGPGGFDGHGPGMPGSGSSYRPHFTPGGPTGATGSTGTTMPTPPTPTQVTITTNSSTTITVGGQTAGVKDLAAGDRFVASFTGSSSDSITTLVQNAALSVHATPTPKPHQLYAFVGSVTSVTPAASSSASTGTGPSAQGTAGTVTVTITAAYPNSLSSSGASDTFTVGTHTLIFGGTGSTGSTGFMGGSLSDVAKGDIVAGGVIGDSGMTLAQVESTPLTLLLDLPTPGAGAGSGSGSGSGSANANAKRAALKRALQLLGKTTKHKKTHKHN